MYSQEINRVCEGADTVVLFIHGIIESSDFFEEYMALVPDHFSACSILLDGHGRTVEEFCASSMEKWKAQLEDKIAELSAFYKNILIVGHSMGSLFAIELAVKYPEIIQGIFIMGTPLRLWITHEMPVTMMRIYFRNYTEKDKRTMAYVKAYGMKNWLPLWRYIGWLPRYFELFRDIKVARKAFWQLHVPCWAVHSKLDEVVSRTVIRMFQKDPCVRLTVLPTAHHLYYPPQDRKLLEDSMTAFYNSFCTHE